VDKGRKESPVAAGTNQLALKRKNEMLQAAEGGIDAVKAVIAKRNF
jgi:hypothetical protein